MPKAEKSQEEVAIEFLPLVTLEDYVEYNRRARLENKKQKMKVYDIKPAPVELHAKQRVVFSNIDQPKNPQPVSISDDMIDYQETLVPGQVYDIPVYVLEKLEKLGRPIWDWVSKPNGEKETKKVGKEHRFAFRSVYSGEGN